MQVKDLKLNRARPEVMALAENVNNVKKNMIAFLEATKGNVITLSDAIKDSKRPIKAVVFDQNEDIFKYIRKEIIAATIDHEPFSQGYNPIILMYNHLVDGYELSSERELSGATVIDIVNIDDHVVI